MGEGGAGCSRAAASEAGAEWVRMRGRAWGLGQEAPCEVIRQKEAPRTPGGVGLRRQADWAVVSESGQESADPEDPGRHQFFGSFYERDHG